MTTSEAPAPQSGTVTKADGTVCPATRYFCTDGTVFGVTYTVTTGLDSYTGRKAPAKLAATFVPTA